MAGNFDFVKLTMPALHGDCVRAESYLASDPRAACIYSRRAAERLVDHLYDVIGLSSPYADDFAALANGAEFKARTGTAITAKLNLLRKVGNDAVHATREIRPDVAARLLAELHHLMVWAGFHYSPHPDAAPLQARFDPTLAAKAGPLSRDEVVRLAARFAEQDAALAAARAEKDELVVAHERELAALRARIAAVQASTSLHDDRDYTEAETRDIFIDVLLGEAGWPLDEPRDREYEVTGMPNQPGVGFVDYVLWGADGRPLAVVEAKRTRKSATIGQQQAKLYADCLETQFGRRPVVFFTNGYEHWLWDDAAGYPPRQVQGFCTRDELELMIQRRHSRRPLSGEPVNTAIAGRPYQVRAIKAVGEVFDARQREALLVMATGSGKTRTVIALVEALMKANWVKRVLFLADRVALVNQTVGVFKAQLPSVTTVNLVTEKNADGRVYVSTYPTMLGLLNETDDKGRRFGPGYFDLVVIDEAHRSVYAKYGAIFDYFDSLLVGLTATPKDEVDHNTYRLFHLEDGVPTDAYSLDDAVADGYLVPPRGVSVGTKFLRGGIRYDDLTDEEKDEWDSLDWGEDGPPTEVSAEEINRFLFNEDTVDKVLATLMTDGYRVAGGDRIGKTIIFAKNRNHADFIQKRYDIGWPQHAGHVARVVTHETPYAQSLIDNFSDPDKAPHIAISVDMLDTGIDVPEVVNLVFFKMVRSKSKFWQMLGRGTRLRPSLFGPGEDKRDFLVFDFCGNLEFFSQDLPASEGSLQKSLAQRLFETRLALIHALDGAHADHDLRASLADGLHGLVAGMTLDNVLVRPHRLVVERFGQRSTWDDLSEDDLVALEDLSGLPSAANDDDELAKRFDLLVVRRQLAQLTGEVYEAERLREAIQELAVGLLSKANIPSVAQHLELIEAVAGDEWWVDVTLPMLELVRLRLRGLVRLVDPVRRAVVYTDFEDQLQSPVSVTLPGTSPGTDMARFAAKAAAYLRAHEDNFALQRVRRNRQLTPEDLSALEQMLLDSGAGGRANLDLAAARNGGLGLFIRSLVGLDRAAATEAFAAYLDGTRFSVDQVRFVQLIIEELTANGVMEPSRLYESPYTDHGLVDAIFPEELGHIVKILQDVKANATTGRVA
ncbi:MAG: DEAD/DEAH box helicase family protein [Propionibacteriaceae bacterium]